MNKYDFSNTVFLGGNVVIGDNMKTIFFSWKKLNIVLAKKNTEYHYRCENTGAFMCKEYKAGGGLKRVTYSLPDSEDYNIKTEEELIKQLKR